MICDDIWSYMYDQDTSLPFEMCPPLQLAYLVTENTFCGTVYWST